MDLWDGFIRSAVEHAPLVIGIGVIYWWSFPRLLRGGLQNGSGEVVRNIVRQENAEQTMRHQEAFDRRLKEHEDAEARRFEDIEARLAKRRRPRR